jgi:predicted SAM-dependent methyltransferase
MNGAVRQINQLIKQLGRKWFHRFRNRFVYGQRFGPDITRLHLGCGGNLLPGWANVDFNGNAHVLEHDLTRTLPLAAKSIEFIYTEHFIEHVTREQAVSFLSDCFRVLKPGGTIRISTPNLRRLIDDYLTGPQPEWNMWDWAPKTSCQMINAGMRLWGHVFIYDSDEMNLVLTEAGFREMNRVAWGESKYPELRGLETRQYHDDIIVESTK